MPAMKILASALWAIALLPAGAADPAFVTSDKNGGWAEGGYYVHNNMWNSAKYEPCTSTLHAWSHDQWQVVTRMNNRTGDGAVKTYPNVHRDYHGALVSSFESITSSFAEKSPGSGIYNFAYDLWLNGIARPGCTEIMIWTENCKQVPGGSYVQDVVFDARTYKVYRRAQSGYIAFVAAADFRSGTVNLLDFMKWVIARGWLPETSTLDQVCFGVELVSTDDQEATFQVAAFSIDSKLKPAPEPVRPASATTNATPVGNRN
jgi:hypothetical protein